MDWKTIDAAIEEKSLLKHPFYQAWSAGELTREDLRVYAAQYYHLESHFPRLLSRIHSNCAEPAVRRTILENLADEELGSESHRELWLRFAEGLGLDREEVLSSEAHPKTRAAIEELDRLADADPATGLSALYAYESQQPRVAASKIDGLKRFYGMTDERSLKFFEVHKEMDAWHGAQERAALERLGPDLGSARAAAERSCEALRTFLDGVCEATGRTVRAC